MTQRPLYSRIIGTGSTVPPNCVTNQELAERLAARGIETSDEWITARTGIRQRYFATPDTMTSDLALTASKNALCAANIDPQSIDLVIVATSTPDSVLPSMACLLQHKLRLRNDCTAFDMQAACTGFVYALTIADQCIRGRMCRTALVVGAEIISRLLDFDDRSTCVLFGDGAGAVVLQASEQAGLISSVLHADGSHTDILCVPGRVSGGAICGQAFMSMDGQAVFKLAVNLLEKVALEALDKAHMRAAQIDWLIPHQANIRIMQSTCRKLELPLEHMLVTVDRHGNTSAASIPLALDEAVRDGRIARGHTIMIEGVGSGVTWGAAIIRF